MFKLVSTCRYILFLSLAASPIALFAELPGATVEIVGEMPPPVPYDNSDYNNTVLMDYLATLGGGPGDVSGAGGGGGGTAGGNDMAVDPYLDNEITKKEPKTWMSFSKRTDVEAQGLLCVLVSVYGESTFEYCTELPLFRNGSMVPLVEVSRTPLWVQKKNDAKVQCNTSAQITHDWTWEYVATVVGCDVSQWTSSIHHDFIATSFGR